MKKYIIILLLLSNGTSLHGMAKLLKYRKHVALTVSKKQPSFSLKKFYTTEPKEDYGAMLLAIKNNDKYTTPEKIGIFISATGLCGCFGCLAYGLSAMLFLDAGGVETVARVGAVIGAGIGGTYTTRSILNDETHYLDEDIKQLNEFQPLRKYIDSCDDILNKTHLLERKSIYLPTTSLHNLVMSLNSYKRLLTDIDDKIKKHCRDEKLTEKIRTDLDLIDELKKTITK